MKRLIVTLADEDHAVLRRLAHRDRRSPALEARFLLERVIDYVDATPVPVSGPPVLVALAAGNEARIS